VTVDTTTPFVFQVDAGPIGPDGYGGILDAVQGGRWLMLDPLSSGMHTLTFGATVPSLDPFTGAKTLVCHGVGGMFAASGTIIMSNEPL